MRPRSGQPHVREPLIAATSPRVAARPLRQGRLRAGESRAAASSARGVGVRGPGQLANIAIQGQ